MLASLENKFHDLNHLGIIPGPAEDEKGYQARAAYCLSLKMSLREGLLKEIPLSKDPFPEENLNRGAFEKTEALFGTAPDWVPIFLSNYQLRPWLGGCAWIFQVREDSPKAALIQLRRQFRDSSSYLKIYDREELLAHEYAHIGRLAFEEPKFEEFFAYRTSSSKFRRYFGPIVQSSFESLVFLMVLCMILVLDIFALSIQSPHLYSFVLYNKLIPLGLIGMALVRLYKRHTEFDRCGCNLAQILEDPQKVEHVMYRLTDSEISAFSRMETTDIQSYIEKQKSESFRWKFIISVYYS